MDHGDGRRAYILWRSPEQLPRAPLGGGAVVVAAAVEVRSPGYDFLLTKESGLPCCGVPFTLKHEVSPSTGVAQYCRVLYCDVLKYTSHELYCVAHVLPWRPSSGAVHRRQHVVA